MSYQMQVATSYTDVMPRCHRYYHHLCKKLQNGRKYSMLSLTELFNIRFLDKKSTEAVANLAKRRNVYTPSSIQIHSRSSGSFSSHGPQTPTFQGVV